jgi:predicted dinucleotide-binding enzyme
VRIGVFGTGPVGHAIATRLVETGHTVTMGSRDAANPAAVAWAAEHGGSAGDFAAAAKDAEVVVNATGGGVSLAAFGLAGSDLAGVVVLDVSNALDFSGGSLTLSVPRDDSVAERLQRAYPAAKVVKALNTMNGDVMVHPELVPAPHEVFIAADDSGAKAAVTDLLRGFGWPAEAILDVGGLTAARGLEAGVLFWVTLRQALGSNRFNFHLSR